MNTENGNAEASAVPLCSTALRRGTQIQFIETLIYTAPRQMRAMKGELGKIVDHRGQGLYWVRSNIWPVQFLAEHGVDFVAVGHLP
jgi:hypothetical protein